MPSTEHLDQKAPAVDLPRDRIPNLDLAPLFARDETGRAHLVEQIRKACLETGFFYMHNSCVASKTIIDTLKVMQKFFPEPDEGPVKQAVHNRFAGEMKGWGPMFGEPAYQKGTVAHVESFDIGQELREEQYRELGIDPNIWPEIPGFRETVLRYNREVTELGRALATVFSELLGMDRDFINLNSGEKAPRTMRLLHYPANPAPSDDRNVGISAHTDFECFTIMNQTAAGLELTDVNGNWCKAPSDIGSFTVILGDMIERFSNGHFKATGHRVANTDWTRYSMILFFAVDGDYEVAPLPQFTSSDNPTCYSPITQDEHITRELARAESNMA